MLISFPLVYYFAVNPIDLSVMGEEAVQTYEKFGMEPISSCCGRTGNIHHTGYPGFLHYQFSGAISLAEDPTLTTDFGDARSVSKTC